MRIPFSALALASALSLPLHGCQQAPLDGHAEPFQASEAAPEALDVSAEPAPTLSAAEKDHILRGSCWAMKSEDTDMDDLAASGCRLALWARYLWLGVRRTETSDGAGTQRSVADLLSASAEQLRANKARLDALGSDMLLEVAISEQIVEDIENVPIDRDIRRALGDLGIRLPDRFTFGKLYDRNANTHPHGWDIPADHWWSCVYSHANPSEYAGVDCRTDFEKNGYASLDSEQGLAWHLYVAATFLRAGAGAIALIGNSYDPKTLVRFVDTLRKLKPGVLVRIPGVAEAPWQRQSTYKLRDYVDYQTEQWDYDVYSVKNGQRTVGQGRPGQKDATCVTLRSATANQQLIPLQSGSRPSEQFLCRVDNSTNDTAQLRGKSRFGNPHQVGRMTDRTRVNPFRIPVIMHLESDVDDCDPVYLGDTDQTGGLTNTCYKEVRHGLYNTMLYMTRPKVVRDTFNRYMYQLACDLTSKSGFPVYWSLTVRGSQNQLGQVYRKAADGTADDTAWQQMKSYLPYCPKGDGDRGYTGAEVRNPNLFQRHCGGFELFRELVTNGCGGT